MTRCVRAIVAEELGEHDKFKKIKDWFSQFPEYNSEYQRCWRFARRDSENLLDLYKAWHEQKRRQKGKGKGGGNSSKGKQIVIGARYGYSSQKR